MTERTRSWTSRAFAPILPLEPEEIQARRIRALALLPFLAAVGFGTALVLERDRGVPLVLGWLAATGGFAVLTFLASMLEAIGRTLLRAIDRGFAGGLVTVGVDALLGAAVGAVLASSYTEPALAPVALCGVLLPIYNLVLAQFVFGGLVEWGWNGLFMGGPALPPQYSRADALAARGLYDDAVAAVLADCRKPDAATFTRIARMMREGHRYETAADWLRRALAHASDPHLEHQLARELCELYTGRLAEPARAIPVLARLADTRRGSPAGEWAAQELRALKPLIHEQPGA